MFTFLVIVHVIVCFCLIFLVLLQRGRGAEMGVTFGGSSQTLFGPGGSMDFFNKLTTGLAILFFITSLSLSYLAAKKPVNKVSPRPPVAKEATEKAPSSPSQKKAPQ